MLSSFIGFFSKPSFVFLISYPSFTIIYSRSLMTPSFSWWFWSYWIGLVDLIRFIRLINLINLIWLIWLIMVYLMIDIDGLMIKFLIFFIFLRASHFLSLNFILFLNLSTIFLIFNPRLAFTLSHSLNLSNSFPHLSRQLVFRMLLKRLLFERWDVGCGII